tara:strand:- start:5498 stop:6685 length:1188 start_codon:yes stop_codon:yes gene_type:complete
MARILTRPMFRKGGLSQTARPSYRGGGMPAIRPRYRRGGMSGIMSGIVPRRGYAEGPQPWMERSGLGQVLGGTGTELRKIGAGTYDLAGVPLNALSRFFTGYNPGFSGARFFGLGEEEGIDPNKAYFLGLTTDATPSFPKSTVGQAQASATPPGGGGTALGSGRDSGKTIKTNGTGNGAKTDRKSDLKTIYEDLLPLFQSTLGIDDSEMNKQAYLELAKFGANLLGQPGGDLAGAIGKAAVPSLEGATRVLETKRQGKKIPAKLALEAAIRETETGSLGKQIKDMMKADTNLTPKAAMEKLTRSGQATLGRTREDRIKSNSVNFEGDGWTKDMTSGRKAAEAIEDSGVSITNFDKWPEDKEDLKPGGYYVKEDGKIVYYDGKEILEYSPKDKKFK